MPQYNRIYKDLDLDFIPNPATGDITTITGLNAIKRSIRNLLQTHNYERKFQFDIGSGIRKILFEPITRLNAVLIQRFLGEVIRNYEPRIEVVSITVDEQPNFNRYDVSISYFLINIKDMQIYNFQLERLK